MSHEEYEMVQLWLKSNQVTREANKVNSPKIRGIILSKNGSRRGKYTKRSIESYGKYIERNF